MNLYFEMTEGSSFLYFGIFVKKKVSQELCLWYFPAKETKLERAAFSLQWPMFVTTEKEKTVFIKFFFHFSSVVVPTILS